MKAFRLLSLLLCVSLAFACKRDKNATSGDYPRRQTLAFGGIQWGEPGTFNPFAVNPDWPVKTPCNLLYQSLLMFDSQAAQLKPLLAKSYRLLPSVVELTLDERARFSDGSNVTAEDVKFSLDIGQKYPGTPPGPLWAYLKEVRVGGSDESGAPLSVVEPNKLSVQMNERGNNLVVLDSLQELRVVPKHVIEPLLQKVNGDLAEFLKLRFDVNPVVSGPYQLHSYSSEKIAVVRRDDYWGNAALHDGKLPAPKYIVHPVYKSNDHYSVALQQGRLDMSAAFMPRIWLKKKKGVRGWYEQAPYFVATGMPMLLLNVNRAPLHDVAYRRAMALSVNYQDIQDLAVSGYSEALQPGLILPSGPESRYFFKEDADRLGASRYEPDAARRLLSEAGYHGVFDRSGNLVSTLDKYGNKVPTVYVKSPTGWTDWEAIVRIAVRGMRAVGIDARERFVDASVFWQATTTGDFDLIMKFVRPQPSPAQPWARFESALTTQGFTELGQKAYKNEGRFNDRSKPGYQPRFDELLELIPTLTQQSELTQAYRELNALVMQFQPVLPMVYRSASFYQVSTRVWTGFPFAEDPFLPGALVGEHLGTDILWHLRNTEP
jgi:peptide/nickel transport system substrate-binding protein